MKKTFFILFLALIFGVAGCWQKDEINEKDMDSLASSLTKLSKSVESTCRYKNPPEGIGDKELLTLATKHDPELLHPFDNYSLKVSCQDKHAIILVCTKDGKRALLEDAGCSAEMDRHLWKSSASCKFTLKAGDVCKKP